MKIEEFKKYVMEFTGSLGDLGTFLPIACGLIMVGKVDGTRLFLVAGLLYIAAGIYFRIPMPVQPLKATSSLAIALGASAATISFVAFIMALSLFAIIFFKLDTFIARVFTRAIIRGIQLGLAIILIKSGLKLILAAPGHTTFHAAANSLDISQAFFALFLPQLPLTLGNSIYATKDTAHIYFKDKAHRVTPRALFISLGIANLVAGCAGGIPLCHGSSGVTAHYRFGARRGVSGICIGAIFILIAAAFFMGAGKVIQLIPFWFLGLSLVYIGIRHAALIKDIIPDFSFASCGREKFGSVFFSREFCVALIIGLYTLISGNLAIAFLIGMGTDLLFKNIAGYLNERCT